MEYKDLILLLRKTMLLSQTEFAKKLGVSFATVNRWEKGHHNPTYKQLRKIKELCLKYEIPFEVV